MVKTKVTPQMIRRMQQTVREEKMPQNRDEKNNFQEEQSDNKDLDQNQKDEWQQLKIKKEAVTQKRIGEIENEMRMLSQQRQEEMRKRREEIVEQQQKQDSEQKKTQGGPALEISSKPKKGMPFWGKRIKAAQQQSQPETAGRRTAG
jgi:hypothetical protein